MALDWGVRPGRAGLPPLPLALGVFFVAFTITMGSAVWLASSLRLPAFLLLSELSGRQRWRRYFVYGIGGGLLIYLTNSALYLTTESAEFRPAQVYNLDNELKVFALSARAALSEETMYRLFAIPFLVSLGMRFYGWRPRFGFDLLPTKSPTEPVRPPRIMVLAAMLCSALLFGLAHNNNPVAAFMFGLLLGNSFLRGGWESAVTAHFLGNYLLFMGIYL
ncbi:MAG TPA: CPBP family glutamic-type intramembrane protease [Acidobacteriota bacterium]|jgi:hypothetical protein|nr:CPBP family glutamic-type intramembrane protease [Acidobacteriota bacterium]|tara:strand:- start:149 stop:808 length:660 start_codon:yes stop_codon:yes gene_type:complete